MGDDSDEYEILDLTSKGSNWVNKVFGDVSKQTAVKQVAIGGVTGWIAGYMLVKVGKVAAASIGTTVLILQLAQHQGYIDINWKKVEREMNQAKKELQYEANKRYPGTFNNIKKFIQHNVFVAGGFIGGFFLGMAC